MKKQLNDLCHQSSLSEGKFLERLKRLEKEKEDLMRDKETLRGRYEALMTRIEKEEMEMKQSLQDLEEQQRPLMKSLQDSHYQLENREKEYEHQLKAAQHAKETFHKAQEDGRHKAELLEKQLKIFQQHGLSPEEKAFQDVLEEVRVLQLSHQEVAPKCFISCTWESVQADNKPMQFWLGKLSKDLRKVGSRVFFYLDDMARNLRNTMRHNIDNSNCFFILCTPQWNKKIASGLTSTLKEHLENNQAAEMDAGLHTLTTDKPNKDFDPTNHVAYEFVHIWTKVRLHPDSNQLILLHFSGALHDAALPMMKEDSNYQVTEHTDEAYHQLFIHDFLTTIFKLKEGEANFEHYPSLVDAFSTKMTTLKMLLHEEGKRDH